ncbi:RagB/SusD family nutrient uptake outer membrane protein [Pedobacter sp. N36a]|uniref:RagB/SusD family nutrient uptake outer membrane protein n=1 Tax=Pedobacter sp. N36a TaxID=2767996 RepID=UPI0016575FCC|nr:RagB/SusD family nutrient uptake outer membrane protein [Pedobacter sp. N36a]MBC8987310.1 RagB/SusD family nutrient uptake outer membrane protein [Pedobacter sp. N36a]
MKIKFIHLVMAVFLLMAGACKKGGFLDAKLASDLNETTTFTDSVRTIAFLTRLYTNVGFNFDANRWEGGGHPVLADEAIPVRYTGPQNDAILMASGALSASSTNVTKQAEVLNNWKLPWENIRRANVFLSNIDRSPLSAGLKKKLKAETRFLRAWYYFQLVKVYGGVPLIGDVNYGIADNIDLPRSSYSDCVDYIVNECNAAAADLPDFDTQLQQDYGRATKGACMGLKSRMLLYAASPLFNGEGIAADAALKSITGYANADLERWNKAAQAAKDIINSGTYSLREDNVTRRGYGFYSVFLNRYNREYLFGGMKAPNREYENNLLPTSRTGSGRSSAPTQQLVDAFGMENGLPITDPASGYNPNDPYLKRDPRFGNSIIYNGSTFFLTSSNAMVAVNTFVGASPDGPAATGPIAIPGYYWRKMMVEDGGGNTDRCYPLIRYAEILLNYAEALNEYQGPTTEVYSTLIQIRKRAGILPGLDDNYGLKSGISKADMRLVIQNERRVELALEEHRLWDVRRWKIAEVTNNVMLKGMKITKTGNKLTYEVIDIKPHFFRPAFYLFPIPESEMAKSPKFVQNPGW